MLPSKTNAVSRARALTWDKIPRCAEIKAGSNPRGRSHSSSAAEQPHDPGMQKTVPGCFFQQMFSSLAGFVSMKRDHMKDLRRYLVLKYIQYLVLSSSNALSTLLGLLGSSYTLLTLQSDKVSSKSTTVLISSLAKADILVFINLLSQLFLWTFEVRGSSPASSSPLLQNLLTANTHLSCLLLSCVALEAFLITFYPTQSRHLRTVRNARLAARTLWILVAAECVLFQVDDLLLKAPPSSPFLLLFHVSISLLRSLSYLLGILLRILNVYIYYKIFFSISHRSALKAK